MTVSERRKGQDAEREVAALFAQAGCSVEQLQRNRDDTLDLLVNRKLYVETKWQERARLWEWITETEAVVPDGSPYVIAFRRSRSPWYGLGPLLQIAGGGG